MSRRLTVALVAALAVAGCGSSSRRAGAPVPRDAAARSTAATPRPAAAASCLRDGRAQPADVLLCAAREHAPVAVQRHLSECLATTVGEDAVLACMRHAAS
jgi:hypothetical protein